jgi:molybdopterin biosynthesis enzyme
MKNLALMDARVAQERLLAKRSPLEEIFTPLNRAVNGTLAERIFTPIDLPMFDNASMDGFAVQGCDIIRATISLVRH